MKKFNFILMIAAIVFGFSAMAQFKFGPKVGVNLAKYSFNFKESDDEPDAKMRLAPMVGLAVNYQFTDELALQSGLFFSGKGTAYDLEEMVPDGYEIDGYERTSTGYIELPINIAYGFPIGENQLQIFAGPYIAYGITGKQKWDYTVTHDGESESDKDDYKIKFRNKIDESDFEDDEDVDYQTALDYGVGFGLGFQTGPILINAGYSLGLANLTPKWDGEGDDNRDDYKYFNRVINVSVAFLFGGE